MGAAPLTGFHHVSFTVRDLVASAAWYPRLFDLDPVMDESGDERQGPVYRLRGTSAMLGLVQHDGNDGSPFRADRNGLDHAAFAVSSRDGMDGWVARLDDAGWSTP